MDVYSLSLLLLALIASLLPTALSTRCYICSWSARDEFNRTNWCTSEHFEPKVVYYDECKFGCETYVQWDKNEDLEHWRRNCAQEGTIVTGKCEQAEDRSRIYRHCTCDSDLCNGAAIYSPLSSLMLVLSSLVVLNLF